MWVATRFSSLGDVMPAANPNLCLGFTGKSAAILKDCSVANKYGTPLHIIQVHGHNAWEVSVDAPGHELFLSSPRKLTRPVTASWQPDSTKTQKRFVNVWAFPDWHTVTTTVIPVNGHEDKILFWLLGVLYTVIVLF